MEGARLLDLPLEILVLMLRTLQVHERAVTFRALLGTCRLLRARLGGQYVFTSRSNSLSDDDWILCCLRQFLQTHEVETWDGRPLLIVDVRCKHVKFKDPNGKRLFDFPSPRSVAYEVFQGNFMFSCNCPTEPEVQQQEKKWHWNHDVNATVRSLQRSNYACCNGDEIGSEEFTVELSKAPLPQLNHLILGNCGTIKTIAPFAFVKSLELVSITSAIDLEPLQGRRLESLSLVNLPKLAKFSFLAGLKCGSLELVDLPLLRNLDCMKGSQIESLVIKCCGSLHSVSGLSLCSIKTSVEFESCTELAQLGGVAASGAKILRAYDLPKLQTVKDLREGMLEELLLEAVGSEGQEHLDMAVLTSSKIQRLYLWSNLLAVEGLPALCANGKLSELHLLSDSNSYIYGNFWKELTSGSLRSLTLEWRRELETHECEQENFSLLSEGNLETLSLVGSNSMCNQCWGKVLTSVLSGSKIKTLVLRDIPSVLLDGKFIVNIEDSELSEVFLYNVPMDNSFHLQGSGIMVHHSDDAYFSLGDEGEKFAASLSDAFSEEEEADFDEL
eukprot:Colp12_sorted_trinity150504_noHs@21678